MLCARGRQAQQRRARRSIIVATPKQDGYGDSINGCTVSGDLARPSTQPKQRKDSENHDNDTDQPKNVVHSFLPV
jgi:hypothetical protein